MAKISMTQLTANLKAAEAAKEELESKLHESIAAFNDKQSEIIGQDKLISSLEAKLATAQRGFVASEASIEKIKSDYAVKASALVLRIDTFLAPMIRQLNTVRRVRDDNWLIWKFTPSSITTPINYVFTLVEQYEVFIGNLQKEISNGQA